MIYVPKNRVASKVILKFKKKMEKSKTDSNRLHRKREEGVTSHHKSVREEEVWRGRREKEGDFL